MGIVDSLPENGVDLILRNDLVRGDEVDTLILTKFPLPIEDAQEEEEDTSPVCAVTRSISQTEESRRVTASVADDSPPEPSTDTVAGDYFIYYIYIIFNYIFADIFILYCYIFADNPEIDKHLLLKNVDINRFRYLQAEDPDIQGLRSLAVKDSEEKGTYL